MVFVHTADQILRKGLHLAGYDDYMQGNVKREANIDRFKAAFGSVPLVYAEIFSDLQSTAVAAARIAGKEVDIECFLMGIHFLMLCPTDANKSGAFKCCVPTARKWCWLHSKKIQALKEDKVCATLLSFPLHLCLRVQQLIIFSLSRLRGRRSGTILVLTTIRRPFRLFCFRSTVLIFESMSQCTRRIRKTPSITLTSLIKPPSPMN